MNKLLTTLLAALLLAAGQAVASGDDVTLEPAPIDLSLIHISEPTRPY